MLLCCRVCDKVKSGLCGIVLVCVVTCDGVAAKVNLHLLPGIRNLNGMVNVLLDNDLVVSVLIHYNLHISIPCLLGFIRLVVALCVSGCFILELLCDIRRIHKGGSSCCSSIVLMADLVLCCLLQVFDNCLSCGIGGNRTHCSCRVSRLIQLLVLVGGSCPSGKGQGMCRLSDNHRIFIRYLHRNADHRASRYLEGKSILVNALSLGFQYRQLLLAYFYRRRDVLSGLIVCLYIGPGLCLCLCQPCHILQADNEVIRCYHASVPSGNDVSSCPVYRHKGHSGCYLGFCCIRLCGICLIHPQEEGFICCL